MNTTKILRILPVTFGVLAIFASAVFPTAARAEEPAPKCRACEASGTRAPLLSVATETGVPLLSKIPYLSRLFKNTSHKEGERIGVDFDFEIGQNGIIVTKDGLAAEMCESTARPQLFVIRRTAHGPAVAACGKDEPCCGKECEQSSACCEKGCEFICEEKEHAGLSWERIVELTAHNAALEATVEAQEGLLEARAEMMERFAEVMVEKAKLEAKVESLAQQAEFTKEMLALASENARLKAQIEMGEAKLALVHEMAKLAIENEQLKLALKSRHPSGALSSDVEYLPPAPASKPSRTSPAKKASFQQPEPFPSPVGPEPIGPAPSR